MSMTCPDLIYWKVQSQKGSHPNMSPNPSKYHQNPSNKISSLSTASTAKATPNEQPAAAVTSTSTSSKPSGSSSSASIYSETSTMYSYDKAAEAETETETEAGSKKGRCPDKEENKEMDKNKKRNILHKIRDAVVN